MRRRGRTGGNEASVRREVGGGGGRRDGETGGWRETEGEIDVKEKERERERVTRSSCRGDCADVRGKVLRRDSP